VQIEVRSRLAAGDVDLAAVDVRLEGVAQAEMIEMRADPLGRARGGDRTRQRGRQAFHERDRARHGLDPLAQHALVFRPTCGVKVVRHDFADPALDRFDEGRAGQAHEPVHRCSTLVG
jgi:hypothetical protein